MSNKLTLTAEKDIDPVVEQRTWRAFSASVVGDQLIKIEDRQCAGSPATNMFQSMPSAEKIHFTVCSSTDEANNKKRDWW